jgi:hypothetical protein
MLETTAVSSAKNSPFGCNRQNRKSLASVIFRGMQVSNDITIALQLTPATGASLPTRSTIP